MKALKREVRRWSEAVVEKVLKVKVFREMPFGIDAYPALRDIRTWSPGDVVFDVGANEGRAVLRIDQHLPSPSIYAFEPVSSTYEKLTRRTAHLPNVRRFQLALGADRARRPIYLHEKDIMNSFSSSWSEPIGTEEVPVDTLDGVVEREGVEFVHFLKIDTEGHEMAVLEGADRALADGRIGIILLEVGMDPRVSPHTSLERVRSHLAANDYVLHGIFNQSRKRVSIPSEWNGAGLGYHPTAMKYCDAMFVRAGLDGVDPRA